MFRARHTVAASALAALATSLILTSVRTISGKHATRIMLELNARAAKLCDAMLHDGEALRVRASTSACGAKLIDCGVEATGGLEAGRRLAEICLAGLARV